MSEDNAFVYTERDMREIVAEARADTARKIQGSVDKLLERTDRLLGHAAMAFLEREFEAAHAADVSARLVRVICEQEAELRGERRSIDYLRSKVTYRAVHLIDDLVGQIELIRSLSTSGYGAARLRLERDNAIAERDAAHQEVAGLREQIAQEIEYLALVWRAYLDSEPTEIERQLAWSRVDALEGAIRIARGADQ